MAYLGHTWGHGNVLSSLVWVRPSDHIWASLGLLRGVSWDVPESGRLPQSLACGLLTVRRGNFVQSQLLLIYFAAPPSFLWVAASRGRGDFAQAQLQKLLPLLWPEEGPCPRSNPWAGPPLTALWSNYVAGRPFWLLRRPSTKPMFGLDIAATVALNHQTGLIHVW